MPSSEYAVATGGALKLKGSNVAKKKKKKPKQSTTNDDEPKPATGLKDTADGTTGSLEDGGDDKAVSKSLREEDDSLRQEIEKELKQTGRPKTEAERRFEEQRRKRLEERLKRDGVKTHKERVEELNRYLSKLSEHHDMYVGASLRLTNIATNTNTTGQESVLANDLSSRKRASEGWGAHISPIMQDLWWCICSSSAAGYR
jgi:protein FAM32A